MTTITITLSDTQWERLREVAARFKIRPEDLASVGVEELLAQPEEGFQEAVNYTLKKNAELYRRLA